MGGQGFRSGVGVMIEPLFEWTKEGACGGDVRTCLLTMALAQRACENAMQGDKSCINCSIHALVQNRVVET